MSCQAALLRVKLKYLDAWNERRAEVARRYIFSLADKPLGLPSVDDNCSPAWHLFVIRQPQRTQLQQILREAGIDTLIHLPNPTALAKLLTNPVAGKKVHSRLRRRCRMSY